MKRPSRLFHTTSREGKDQPAPAGWLGGDQYAASRFHLTLRPLLQQVHTFATNVRRLAFINTAASYDALQQVHLAYSGVDVHGNPTGMTVVWTSAAGEAPPVVEYGLIKDK